MAIAFELSCACGSAFEYSGGRAGEHEAKAAWALEHAGHSAVAEPEPVAEVVAPEHEPTRRTRKVAVA